MLRRALGGEIPLFDSLRVNKCWATVKRASYKLLRFINKEIESSWFCSKVRKHINAKSDPWDVSKERDMCSTCGLAWVSKYTRGKRRNLTCLAPGENQGPWIA